MYNQSQRRKEFKFYKHACYLWYCCLPRIAKICKRFFNISLFRLLDESSGNWGSRDRTMRQLLECMLHLPASLDSELRFDLQLLALGLTINISEHSTVMREWLLTSSVRVSTTDSNSSVSNLSKRSNAFSAMVEVRKYLWIFNRRIFIQRQA